MKRIALLATLFLLVVAWLASAAPALAANCNTSQTIVGDSYVLAAGQTLDSNLIVLGGNASVAEGAVVSCSVVVFGGSVDIAGLVSQDVVVFGGNAALQGTAVVEGELVTVGGSLSRAEGAEVRGGESQGFDWSRDWFSQPEPIVTRIPLLNRAIYFYQSVLQVIFSSVALGLLALLVVLFWPAQTGRVSAAITATPGASGGLGLLTAVAVPVMLTLLAITLCLIPLSFVGAVVLAAAVVFGWVALGSVVGARLVRALNLSNVSNAVAAALGTGLLALVMQAIGSVECVGWVVPTMLSAIGLGAVALTRFGTRPYLPGAPTPSEPTPPAPVESQMGV